MLIFHLQYKQYVVI